MATYVLIPGAGDVAWYWHLVAAELRERGHDVVAVDLPCDDESAGLSQYADTVLDAIGDRTDLVVVAQSFGAFTAPLVCARVPVDLLVLVAGMVPSPGETGDDWWANTGYEQARRERAAGATDEDDSVTATFFHDVPPALAAEAMTKGRDQTETPFREPWPLDAWPDVPTRYLLCRDDRLFPAEWTRRIVRARLDITPDEIDGGHCVALSRPHELADRLDGYRRVFLSTPAGTQIDPLTTQEEAAMPAPYTIKKLTEVKDSAPEFGLGAFQQTRFANDDLETEHTGFTLQRIEANTRPPFAHRHELAEEVYLVLSGSGRIKLDDDIQEIERLDAIRVAPTVTRAFEAGPEGLELLAFGPRHAGDGEVIGEWWVD